MNDGGDQMAMVVGLKSGKEFLVEDDSYLFFNEKTGVETRVFVSLDEKRVITVSSGDIEYFDEVLSEAFLKELKGTKKVTHLVEDVVEDVNVR